MSNSYNKKAFTVYFEIYGKKMKTMVVATDEADAYNEIRNKLIFHKVERSDMNFNSVIKVMDELFKQNSNK